MIDSALQRIEPGARVRIKIDGGEGFEGIFRGEEHGYVSLINDAGGHTDVERSLITDVGKIVRTPAPE